MAQNYEGGEGTSGLAARAALHGLPDPHEALDESGTPGTPDVDPTLGTNQGGTGVHELAEPPAGAPADDFLAQVQARLATGEGLIPNRPGQSNEWQPPVDPSASTPAPESEPGGDASTASPPASTGDPDPAGTSPGATAGSVPLTGPPPLPWAQPPAPAPAASAPEGTPGEYVIGGLSFTEAELRLALQAAAQQASMTPQQVALWNEFAAGRAQIVPAGQAPAPTAPAPRADPDDLGGDEWLDPRAAAEIARVQAELEQQRDLLRGLMHDEAERARRVEETKVSSAMTTVRSKYNLPADDPALHARLESAALPFAQMAFSDPKSQTVDTSAVYEWALEQAVWNTPELRDAIVASQVQAKVDETLQSDELTRARSRRSKASSLAGSPQGSVARTAPPARDPRTLSEAETRAAMANALRAMDG